jgi:hypothetical protein
MAVHPHRSGFRGTLTLTTSVYPTQAQAETALADLRASVKRWREKPAPASTRLDMWKPSCDYARPLIPSLS